MKRFIIIIAVGLVAAWVGLSGFGRSGFDLSKHSIPVDDILSGGPPKDGIPAIDRPEFVSAEEAGKSFLKKTDRVIGVEIGGKAKAYPIKILNWHEIVNDALDGRRIVISYCPLCGTGMVFDGKSAGRNNTFGVSGLLYQSDMLLYDRKTESLWSQIKGEAVAGKLMGKKLRLLPSTHTTWEAWQRDHPKTLALSTQTGHSRNYERDPYEGYASSRDIMFDVNRQNPVYHPKEWVVGVETGGKTKAYAFSALPKNGKPVEDKIGGTPVKIVYNPKARSARVFAKDGKEIPSVTGFWFAWFAFHPDTLIYEGSRP